MSNIPQNTVDSSRKNTNHNIRVVLLILIILAVLSGVFFAFLLAKNRHQSNQLLTVQNNMQQALDNEKQLQDEHLETMAREIRQLRQDQKDDISKQLQDQYDQIVQRLETLSKSDNGSVSTVANDLLAQLSNQAGDGIGISGPNNTTITNKGVITINNKSGDVSLQGVPNQTTVTQNGNTIAVGTAQDISQTSNPTFNNQTLTGNQTVQGSVAAGGLNIGSTGTQNGYQICDSSNNCGYSGAGYSFVQGGNSYGAPANLGTNDNNPLHIRTNGSTRITVDGSGNTNFTGDVYSGGIISGDGSGLTSINANSLSSGTVSDTRLSSNVTVQGNTFNGASQLVQLTAGGLLPALDGSNLQNVDASSLGGQSASYYTNASNISNGTLGDNRLSSNIALKNSTNTFTGTNNFAGITATGILQNGYQVCDASNNCNYATSSGSGSYVWNGTSLQVANFNIQSASSSSVGAIIQGASGQTANLQEWRNSSNELTSYFSADGQSLVVGKLATSGATGTLTLRGSYNGGSTALTIMSGGSDAYIVQSGSNNSLEIGTAGFHGVIFRANNVRVGQFNGSGLRVGGAAGSINAQLHVYNQSAGRIGAIIQGASGQTADLQQWQNSSGSTIASIQANGSYYSPSAPIKLGFNQFLQGEYSGGGSFVNLIGRGGGNDIFVGDTTRDIVVQGMNYVQIGPGSNGIMLYSTEVRRRGSFGQLGTGSVPWNALYLQSSTSTATPLFVKGASAQTADLQQWQDASGATLSSMDNLGRLKIGTTASNNALVTLRSSSTPTGTPLEGMGVIRINRLSDDGGVLSNSSGAIEYGNSSVRTYRSNNTFIVNAYDGTEVNNTAGTLSATVLKVKGIAGQTGDLLQLQNSSGVALAKFDAGGNLTVKNANIEGAYITFSNNMRGYNIAVSASATSQTVSFGTAHSDANYAVFCTPDWNTTCYVTNKTVNGFTLNYGTPAPASQLVDWFVAR